MGAFGIKGFVKVKIMTDFAERFEEGRRVLLDGEWTTIEKAQVNNNQLVLKLASVPDRNRAEELLGKYIEAVEAERPKLEKDEYLFKDLIGLRVVTKDGQELGKATDVLTMPAHDVLEVGEILIPLIKKFVKKVDLKAGVITVELIEGMLE